MITYAIPLQINSTANHSKQGKSVIYQESRKDTISKCILCYVNLSQIIYAVQISAFFQSAGYK